MDKIREYMNPKVLIVILVVVVILGICWYRREHLTVLYGEKPYATIPFNAQHVYHPAPMVDGIDADGKTYMGDTTYMQNDSPLASVETQYHNTVSSECEGNYFNRFCSQKAYLKTMENGTTSIPDMICQGRYDNEDDYYDCLARTYGNYYPWTYPSPSH